MNELQRLLSNTLERRKITRRLSAFVMCMAFVVSFGVSIGLIMPAESTTGQLICGMEEHEHTAECYELACQYNDSVKAISDTDSFAMPDDTNGGIMQLSDENPEFAAEENEETITATDIIETETTASTSTETTTTETDSTTAASEIVTTESVAEPVADHIHSAECYKLICGKTAHSHSQTCYNNPADFVENDMALDNVADLFGEVKLDEVDILADYLSSEIKDNTTYYIKNVGTGKFLVANANKSGSNNGFSGTIDTNSNNDESNRFTLLQREDGYFHIQTIDYNLTDNFPSILASVNRSGDLQYRVETYYNQSNSLSANTNQRYSFVSNNDGSYRIVSYENYKNTTTNNATCWRVRLDGTVWSEAKNDESTITDYERFIFIDVDNPPKPEPEPDPEPDPDPPPTDQENGIRIEARVIFGDYRDTYKITTKNDYKPKGENTNYFGLAHKLNFNLKYSSDSSLYGSTVMSEQVNSDFFKNADGSFNLVSDKTFFGDDGVWLNGAIADDEMYKKLTADLPRKDWCYQYNYTWENVPKTDGGYYIELADVGTDKTIDIAGKTFKVYYLTDIYLNHPGYSDEENKVASAPTSGYEDNANEISFNGDQIIYIFLEPESDGTTSMTMKKRWDGYNGGDGYKNRPKEKIRVQLQWLNPLTNKWERFEGQRIKNNQRVVEKYYAPFNFEKNNKSKAYVKKEYGTNGYVYYSEGNYFKDEACQIPFNYANLPTNENLGRDERLRVKFVDIKEWNDIVLTVGGENHPQHFTNGYYYSWDDLPAGTYRVVETESFYDANDNNILDEGDRDTSQEYYYMGFPPQRNTAGVFHIQNFTKDMVIEVQKEWYQGNTLISQNKKIGFEIYRSTVKGDPTTENLADWEKVGYFETNENGYAFVTSREYNGDKDGDKTGSGYYYDVHKMEAKNGNAKWYYYIKETNSNGGKLLNGSKEFVYKNGTDNTFGIDYEDGDTRKFIIKNEVQTSLNINKEWYVGDNKTNYYSNSDDTIRPKFEIWKGNQAGEPVSDGNGGFTVNGQALTKISGTKKGSNISTDLFQVNDNGALSVFSSSDNAPADAYISEELTMGSGTITLDFKGNTFNNAKVNGNVNDSTPFEFWCAKNNNAYTFDDPTNETYTFKAYERLSVKPQLVGIGGEVVLNFADVTNCTVTIRYKINQSSDYYYLNGGKLYEDVNCSREITNNNIIISGNKVTIENLEVTPEYMIYAENGNPKLSSATYYRSDATPYYYYIREVIPDNSNYTLKNGNNGFVKTGDNIYHTELTGAVINPVITAKNTADNMSLNITKNWQVSAENSASAKVGNVQPKFTIYRAFVHGTPTMVEKNLKIQVGQNENKKFYALTPVKLNVSVGEISNLPAFELDSSDSTYKKCYYYVCESSSGNYTLLNSTNGFVRDNSGNYGSYFDETGTTARSYTFVNVPNKISITVNKQWLKSDDTDDNNKKDWQITFKLYNNNSKVGDYITAGDNRTITISDLPAFDSNGVKCVYSVVEVDGEKYRSMDYNITYTPNNVAWTETGEQPTIQVVNQPKPQGVELPNTGGNGTHTYIFFGGGLALLSVAVLLMKKRNFNE